MNLSPADPTLDCTVYNVTATAEGPEIGRTRNPTDEAKKADETPRKLRRPES